jgi:hypothetical protein
MIQLDQEHFFVFRVLDPWWPNEELDRPETLSVRSPDLRFRSIAPAVTKLDLLTDDA